MPEPSYSSIAPDQSSHDPFRALHMSPIWMIEILRRVAEGVRLSYWPEMKPPPLGSLCPCKSATPSPVVLYARLISLGFLHIQLAGLILTEPDFRFPD